MTQGEKIIELLNSLVNINANISNQQLDMIDKLEFIRKNTLHIANNTHERIHFKNTKTDINNGFTKTKIDTRTIKC